MLRYVFELASAMLSEPSTPRQIRQQYERVIRELDQKTKAISPQHADYIPLHTADPHVIKQVKEKANDLRVLIPSLSLELREGYYGRWQEDEDYPEMAAYLKDVEEASGAAYIYIVVFSEDHTMRYIYDSSGMAIGT